MPRKPSSFDLSPDGAAYRQKYRDTHYDRVEIIFPRGSRERIDKAAKTAGMSRSAFIIAAVEEHIKKSEG